MPNGFGNCQQSSPPPSLDNCNFNALVIEILTGDLLFTEPINYYYNRYNSGQLIKS